MEAFLISSFEGAGFLRFGMDQEEVTSLVGPAKKKVDSRYVSTFTEHRDQGRLQIVYDRSARQTVSISFYARTEGIIFDGHVLNWDNSKEWYMNLIRLDTSARKVVGVTIFFRLGISTAGLEDSSIGDKSVTVFAKGQFREDDPSLRTD